MDALLRRRQLYHWGRRVGLPREDDETNASYERRLTHWEEAMKSGQKLRNSGDSYRGALVEVVMGLCVGHPRPSMPPHFTEQFIKSGEFLHTHEWKRVRMATLLRYGNKCQCCGTTPARGAVMNVDHIKPRATHPELALDPNNTQVLCDACNAGKGSWDATDWRSGPARG